jgi:hypothetical protein
MSSRRNKAERTAADAWDYLSSAMTTAGGTALDAGKQTADLAGSRAAELATRAGRKAGKKANKAAALTGGTVNAVADEAWTRAIAAANALAGRRPGRPWGLIIGVGLVGIALGYAAATTARAALQRQAENEQLELAETAIIVTPT